MNKLLNRLKKVNKFSDWLLNHVPETIKKPVNKNLVDLKQTVTNFFRKKSNNFKINETRSALKGLVKQFTIEGREGFDIESFMKAVKNTVVRNMEANRQHRVNFYLLCNMERVNPSTGDVERNVNNFHNKSTPLLESTNVPELFDEASIHSCRQLTI